METKTKRLKILLAEDDANDRKLLQLALKQDGFGADIFVVPDGEEVLQYMKGEGGYQHRAEFPFPDLIVLDLKMPRMGGLEVLKWVRGQAGCGTIPVVLLSGSGLDKDVEEAYRTGANSYFQKPNSVRDLGALMKAVAEYWRLTRRPKADGKCD